MSDTAMGFLLGAVYFGKYLVSVDR